MEMQLPKTAFDQTMFRQKLSGTIESVYEDMMIIKGNIFRNNIAASRSPMYPVMLRG